MIPQLAEWESFYIIVGSSGAALTGLMFVVMALIPELDEAPSSSASVGAYGTPNIVHFCASLVVSAVLSAPWRALTSVAVSLGVISAVALVYSLNVVRRARRQTLYKPVLEDWLFHSVFPLAAYATILTGSILLSKAPEPSLFAVGTAVLSLVLIGIQNAWDTVTYLAVIEREGRKQKKS